MMWGTEASKLLQSVPMQHLAVTWQTQACIIWLSHVTRSTWQNMHMLHDTTPCSGSDITQPVQQIASVQLHVKVVSWQEAPT